MRNSLPRQRPLKLGFFGVLGFWGPGLSPNRSYPCQPAQVTLMTCLHVWHFACRHWRAAMLNIDQLCRSCGKLGNLSCLWQMHSHNPSSEFVLIQYIIFFLFFFYIFAGKQKHWAALSIRNSEHILCEPPLSEYPRIYFEVGSFPVCSNEWYLLCFQLSAIAPFMRTQT